MIRAKMFINSSRQKTKKSPAHRTSLKLLSLCAMLIILLSITSSVSAFIPIGDYQLSGGANNILYYIDSEALEYKDSISYGIQYWNNKVSTVSVARTTTKSYSRCDCYWGDYFPYDPDVIAATSFLLNNQYIYPEDSNWYWCEIRFNSEVYNYDEMTYFNRKGTSCHEYGHVLGLNDDNNYPTHVMCQLGSGRTVNSPSYNDVLGVTLIYS